MSTVNIHDAKTHLSRLIAQIEEDGQSIVICRRGRPVAVIGPVPPGPRTETDAVLSRIRVHGDLTEPTADEWEDA
jgi:prevent-host-death family protein